MELVLEWNAYVDSLYNAGFILNIDRDVIVWGVNQQSQTVKENLAYLHFLKEVEVSVCSWWNFTLWSLKIPGWVKYSCWLAINQKILTWDALQARGYSGPRVCVLCHLDVKAMDHIFGSFPLFQQLGCGICASLKKPWQWVSRPLVEIFAFWVKRLSMPLEILCLLIWEVWRLRNACIFQDRPISYHSTMSLVCSSLYFPKQSSRS